MTDRSVQARLYREALIQDPYRPRYHFAIPDGDGYPGDSNGAFYAGGRYHLMYLYRNHDTDAFHWGHISSRDLLHWQHHPDALTTEEGDEGCFSGGGFVDEDGTAYITFWKFASRQPGGDHGGIDIAFSRPPYDRWERIRPLAIEGSDRVWGTMDIGGEHISCADPSNIWKKDGMYYMQTGNLCVLNEYGRAEDSPQRYRGDWTDLFRSADLKNWQFVHRFYHNPRSGEDWPDETEDDMCPSFLPLPDRKADGQLTDRWLQLFIAHNKGAQYYIGDLEGEHFIPRQHGRFSWKDNTLFAPEALIDGRNRHLIWCWLLDNPEKDVERFGWSGVYNFPRCVWYEDGALAMAPAQELDSLAFDRQDFAAGTVTGELPLAVANGESFRIRAEIDPAKAARAGFALRMDPESGERCEVYADLTSGKLVMDTTRSGALGRPLREEAPFTLKEGEKLKLDIFVDRSVVEVYANERQSICRRIFPTHPERAMGVAALSDGADFGTVTAWQMDGTNLY